MGDKLMTKKVIENTFEVLAVEFLAIIQAVDYLKDSGNLAQHTKDIYSRLRDLVPAFTEDTPKYGDLKKIKELLLSYNPEILTTNE